MYNNQFVLAVKANGKVLREFKDVVYVPFGTEYKLLLKNQNSKRAVVRVHIDGKDAGGGTRFVINGNSELDLERFIKSGNLNSGSRFKFIERTEAVANHRGVHAEDGLIRIDVQYEKTPIPYYASSWVYPWGASPPRRRNDWAWGNISRNYVGGELLLSEAYGNGAGGLGSGAAGNINTYTLTTSTATGCNASGTLSAPNEIGVTAPGSVSTQSFYSTSVDVESEVHTLVLRLVGRGPLLRNGVVKLKKAVTVKTKITCSQCGYRSSARNQFCSKCGSALHIV